nr:hypothetical protein [Rhodopirellula sp. SM50]
MAKLYFYYSTMNAGKSTTLLQCSYNYHERGMKTLILLPEIDTRDQAGKVRSGGMNATCRFVDGTSKTGCVSGRRTNYRCWTRWTAPRRNNIPCSESGAPAGSRCEAFFPFAS